MSTVRYYTTKETCETIGVIPTTLRSWANKGKIKFIRTPTNHRRYDVVDYLKTNDLLVRKNICYCRVSSHDRKEDLERQVKYLSDKYPDYEVVTDIGSGINFKRPGLQKIIDIAIKDQLNSVVVTYKDRLCRIGYDLIEHILSKYSNAAIIVENKTVASAQTEITEDLIEIVTVYASKIHGKKSYTKTDPI